MTFEISPKRFNLPTTKSWPRLIWKPPLGQIIKNYQRCPCPELYTQAVTSVVWPKGTVCQGYVTFLRATRTSTLIPKPNTNKGSNKLRAILGVRDTIYLKIIKNQGSPWITGINPLSLTLYNKHKLFNVQNLIDN